MAQNSNLNISLEDAQSYLATLKAEERLSWAQRKFHHNFAITTSFGIQSAVLLNMVHLLQAGSEIPVI